MGGDDNVVFSTEDHVDGVGTRYDWIQERDVSDLSVIREVSRTRYTLIGIGGTNG
jgi:hypothetical protein